MGIIKECIICGKEFNITHSRQICCCEKCSIANRKNKKRIYEHSKKRRTYKKKYYYSPQYQKYIRSKKYKLLQLKHQKTKKRIQYKKVYNKQYQKNPKYIAYIKKRNKTAKFKAQKSKYMKKYIHTKQYKITIRKYWKTDKYKASLRKRRAMENNIIDMYTEQEWQNKLKATKGVCPGFKRHKHFVGFKNLKRDHIYSIAIANKDFLRTGIKRKYYIKDMQPLCTSCNSSKNNKIIII